MACSTVKSQKMHKLIELHITSRNQSKARAVKIVTEVTSTVYGEENQRNKVIAILASRKNRKAYSTKRDYTVV